MVSVFLASHEIFVSHLSQSHFFSGGTVNIKPNFERRQVV